MEPMQGKQDTRNEMRSRRKALSPDELARASRAICERLASDEAFSGGNGSQGPIAVYMASQGEPDLAYFIDLMLRRGATVVAPRWNGKTYELAKVVGLSEKDLRRGPMNILEPAVPATVAPGDVAAWIVPGLAFTMGGKRLGYGGGWYDRLLAAARGDSAKIGVAHGFQVVDDLPSEPHDIPLDRVVTDG